MRNKAKFADLSSVGDRPSTIDHRPLKIHTLQLRPSVGIRKLYFPNIVTLELTFYSATKQSHQGKTNQDFHDVVSVSTEESKKAAKFH